MIDNTILNTLTSILGLGKSTSRGNWSFHCPKCKHHKRKLEVNLDPDSSYFQHYSCWVCSFRGKTIKSLLKSIGESTEKYKDIKFIFDKIPKLEVKPISTQEIISLPKEFISLIDPPKTLVAKHALNYLKQRDITKYDIIKHNIGYCEYGIYSNRIIIPSYDNEGKLNYFSARSFEKDAFLKYKNPKISRDIIPFELFINWNLPLILCEGPLDALTIKRNAIPLLGKSIPNNLMKKIVTSTVQKIYIALDKDALKEALNYCEQLMKEGKEIYLLDLQEKDPNEMGFVNFTNLIQKTYPMSFSDLLGKKLQIV